ncbi:hypothetical protein [Pseudarthrobacter sp. DSP2-3-2b1]|uniref:hypothetical protein n=1 Tax=Pseudarthrobacter sp. DSP2-3-2b1 TaxID=2804661 RepID=UPI003CF9156F
MTPGAAEVVRDSFLRRWFVSVTLAEAAGFAIPAIAGGSLALYAAPAAVVYPALVLAGAWAVGLLWTLAPSPFIDETTPVPILFAVYLLAGLLMAATVAVLTGFAARRVVSGAG